MTYRQGKLTLTAHRALKALSKRTGLRHYMVLERLLVRELACVKQAEDAQQADAQQMSSALQNEAAKAS